MNVDHVWSHYGPKGFKRRQEQRAVRFGELTTGYQHLVGRDAAPDIGDSLNILGLRIDWVATKLQKLKRSGDIYENPIDLMIAQERETLREIQRASNATVLAYSEDERYSHLGEALRTAQQSVAKRRKGLDRLDGWQARRLRRQLGVAESHRTDMMERYKGFLSKPAPAWVRPDLAITTMVWQDEAEQLFAAIDKFVKGAEPEKSLKPHKPVPLELPQRIQVLHEELSALTTLADQAEADDFELLAAACREVQAIKTGMARKKANVEPGWVFTGKKFESMTQFEVLERRFCALEKWHKEFAKAFTPQLYNRIDEGWCSGTFEERQRTRRLTTAELWSGLRSLQRSLLDQPGQRSNLRRVKGQLLLIKSLEIAL